jgi:hypothetical protein
MMPNVSQYSSQGPIPQFQGLQGVGSPQMGPGVFGQPGAYGGNASFGHDSGQAGVSQSFPFGVQANPFAPYPFTQPVAQNPYLPGVPATNPYAQSPWLLNSTAHNPLLSSAGINPASQVAPLLAHLAQQLAIQGAVTQQIGIALHQLTQQLAGQGAQGYPGVGFGGFNPQAQAWGANRPQTIQ